MRICIGDMVSYHDFNTRRKENAICTDVGQKNGRVVLFLENGTWCYEDEATVAVRTRTKQIQAVIFRRSTEENSVAVVRAECDPEMVANTSALFGAISQAVTRWASDSPIGKQVLKANGGVIHIGDLAPCGTDHDLLAELGRYGVLKLTITRHCGEQTSWEFDDNLFEDASH